MAEVTINGHTYSDDSHPDTGLAGGGHRQRFIPALQDVVAVAGEVAASAAIAAQNAGAGTVATTKASEAAASAATATTKAAEAAVSAANAAAVVTGGTATLLPEAGKIPLAGADTQIPHGWVAPPALPLSRPSLLLDFKNGHIDPRITFTRASTATYWDNQGVLRTALSGEPRIDHDPLTGACLGLLIEEQRTNLRSYSDDFSNAVWTKIFCSVISNVSLSPAGTVTMEKLVEDASNNIHYLIHSAAVTTVIGNYYTRAIFAKKEERTKLSLQFDAAGFSVAQVASFDLVAKTAVVTTGGGAAWIVDCGNNIFRCIFTSEAATAVGVVNSQTRLLDAGGNTSYLGDGSSGLYLWGDQFEIGKFATSYIPTTSAQSTRAADMAIMSAENFSSWYRAAEGTFVAGHSSGGLGVGNIIANAINANDGTSGNALALRYYAGSAYPRFDATATVGGSSVVDFSEADYAINVAVLHALAYKTNDFAYARGGAAIQLDTAGAVPVVNQMSIGSGGRQHIQRVAYYPKRLSNAEIVALSAG